MGLIQQQQTIRIELEKRIKELGLKHTDIIKDAKARGYKLSSSNISKYFKNSPLYNLRDEDIIWLAYRYGIYTSVQVGIPVMVDNKIKYVIPAYNEEKCLKILSKLFPNVEEIKVHNSRPSKKRV